MHDSFDSERFECQCASFQHSVRIMLDKEEGDIYVNVNLSTYLPWHKRLWRALKYVVSPGTSRFGHYDEVILEPRDYERIENIFVRSREIRKRNEEMDVL